MRVCTVTPAGRRPYLQILAQYLLRHRHIINEHRFWVNTYVQDDLNCIDELCAAYPDFFKKTILPLPVSHKRFDSWQLYRFFNTCTDPDTIYIRLDDDICWIADDAIEKLVSYRISNPHPFLVYGNVINNGVCNHLHQRKGLIPTTKGICTYNCTCDFSWKTPEGGVVVHEAFLNNLKAYNIDEYKFRKWILWYFERVSINVISWMGKDAVGINVDPDEEPSLSSDIPKQLNRCCEICGDALFCHFSYHTQRSVLEPIYLPIYKQLAGL